MKITLLFLCSFLAILQSVQGQSIFSLTGTVKDAETEEPLIGVAVSISSQGKGVVTDINGNYSLTLTAGSYELQYSYVGYKSKTLRISVDKDLYLAIKLEPVPIETGEVIISSKREEENLSKTVDNISLSQKEISSLPYLLGQIDPLKTLQLLPGAQSNGEGNNGLFVRGGAIDQNLILFDKAPVYNTGHLFGFFSLFNHSIIDNVNLIKGSIPASYGGRLSSVLEINSRSGDFQKVRGEGTIGVVSGNFSLEGPISKGKSSFLICGRRTYIDLLSKLLTDKPTIFNTGIDYYFDDLNFKIDTKISSKDRLALSAFTGTDDFMFFGKSSLSNSIRWKNHTASLSWSHFYNNHDFLTTTVYASKYKMDFSAGINFYTFNIHSSIQDYGLKSEWEIGSVKDHRFSFGFEYIRYALVPNNMKAKGGDLELHFTEQEKLHNQEQAIFFQDEIKLSGKLTVSGGLRLSGYQQLGPFSRYIANEAYIPSDTIFYKTNSIIKSYWNADPRLSMSWQLNDHSSLKAAYDRMHQYMHMAPVSSVSLPTDIWVPSSAKIKPQLGTQYSLGYFRNFNNNSIETSATVYYKTLNRQIEFRDGIIVGYSKGFNFDDNFIFGKGNSYGLEMFIRKSEGRLKGWLSYTLSRTFRTFDEINRGARFPAKYDRLHNFSWVNNYQLTNRWTLSGVFTYSTGNALTLPLGRYIMYGNIINHYEGRNTFRMPSYHRMDLSATYKAGKKENSGSYWIFSVYNAYNRKNPYYIYFDVKGNVNENYLEVKLEKVSLFPIIPSVAYQFKF